ncbi:MAG: FlgD immunoglobulin-like domain containing protein [Candidatus Eisenbacteria bacterium]
MGHRTTGFHIRALAVSFLLLLGSGNGAVASIVIITPEGGKGSLEEAETALREAGGEVCHRFPGEGLIADLFPGEIDALAGRLSGEWRVDDGLSVPESPLRRRAESLYGPPRKGRGPASGRPLSGDAFEPPRRSGKGGEEPGFWDGSEYLLGDVGVAVFFLESNGAIDPSIEDWTGAERLHVQARMVEATEWWRSRAPEGFLRFTYEFRDSVPVPYEPIARPQGDEELWIREALASFGFSSGDRFSRTQSYLNDMKARLGLDWAFAVYVIDSSEDEDGMFSDGYFAYAYVGGPFAVLTLDNDGWGTENFASVFAHEMGHVFYALDQYAAARVPCDRASGYLGAPTANSQYGGCPESEPNCLMRSTHLDVAVLSETARAQVGWLDDDGNGVPDAVDHDPSLSADAVTRGDTVEVTGEAAVVPAPNRNPLGYGNDLSVSTLVAVEYRTPGAEWRDVPGAVSGKPSASARFVLPIPAGEAEEGRVELRARDSAGLYSPSSSVAFSGGGEKDPAAGGTAETPPGPVRILGNRPNPFNPSTEFHLSLEEAVRVRLEIYDTRGVLVCRLVDDILTPGETAVSWDGRDSRGRTAPSGRYFFRVLAGGESRALPITLLR